MISIAKRKIVIAQPREKKVVQKFLRDFLQHFNPAENGGKTRITEMEFRQMVQSVMERSRRIKIRQLTDQHWSDLCIQHRMQLKMSNKAQLTTEHVYVHFTPSKSVRNGIKISSLHKIEYKTFLEPKIVQFFFAIMDVILSIDPTDYLFIVLYPQFNIFLKRFKSMLSAEQLADMVGYIIIFVPPFSNE